MLIEHVHVLLDFSVVGVHISLLIFTEEFVPELCGLFVDGVPVSLEPLPHRTSWLLCQASFNLDVQYGNVVVGYPGTVSNDVTSPYLLVQ